MDRCADCGHWIDESSSVRCSCGAVVCVTCYCMNEHIDHDNGRTPYEQERKGQTG